MHSRLTEDVRCSLQPGRQVKAFSKPNVPVVSAHVNLQNEMVMTTNRVQKNPACAECLVSPSNQARRVGEDIYQVATFTGKFLGNRLFCFQNKILQEFLVAPNKDRWRILPNDDMLCRWEIKLSWEIRFNRTCFTTAF